LLRIPFLVGAGQIVGQGNSPELWVLYTTDDASISSPVWVDATSKTRSVDTSRGRETELQPVDTGNATVRVDNRTRTFDPNSNANIRPLNRWWIREQFSGKTRDLFKGYAERYENKWPSGGWSDAEAEVSLADEFKVLNLDALPTTSPARNSYPELVAYDNPEGYWRLNQDPTVQIQAPISVEPETIPPNPLLTHIGPSRTPRHGKGWV
jgi:hypothetical protein